MLALLAAVIGAAGYLLYRRVLRPLLVRFADLDIAMRIEERWPGLNDRLASTIQFLQLDAGDERYGSPALARGDGAPGLAETDAIDFREVIEPRPVVRAAGGGGGALALGGAVPGRGPGVLADRHDAAVRAVRRDRSGRSRPTSSSTRPTRP